MPTSPDPKSVLILEDDWRIAAAWRDELEASGLRVVVEDNAENGILSLQQEQFDVAIVDLMLPNQNGSVTREGSLMLLASIALRPFLAPKVLAVSGLEETTQLYQRYGILSPADTLIKPIDPDALKKRVLGLVDQRDREQEASKMFQANQHWALQRFKFATDHSQDAIYWVHQDGTFFYVNDGACEMLGYSREELLHLKVSDIDPDYPEEIWAEHWERMRRDQFIVLEPTHVDATGQRFSTLMHVHFYNFEGDEFIIGTARDISELKRYTFELEKANRDLAEFSYIASHDLKAPLRAIDQVAGWLEEDLVGQLPADSERHLKIVRQRVKRMEALLRDLLEYSRAGRKREEPSEVDLRELLDEVIGLAVSDTRFTIETDVRVSRLTTKRTPLATVLRNLISNAVKHHDQPSGKIKIECVKQDTRDSTLLFTVADDGPGIEPAFHAKAFAVFQTLQPRDVMEGSGMGLALVKRLVETEDGRVWIESNEPRGAKFCFTWR